MRLLVIEDYPPLQQSLVKGLREAGFAVDATRDGADGLWYAMGSEYDVIILDLMLPSMPGLEILKKIRAADNKAQVLILTAKDTVEDRVAGLDLGADDYLVKPFAFEEFLARIRALVRRGYRRKTPEIKIKDLQIPRRPRRPGRLPQRYMGAPLRIRLRRFEQCRRCLYRLPAKEARTAR